MAVGTVHVYTSFTYAYLSRARILARSVRARHPDWTLWAFLVDRPPDGFDDSLWQGEFDHVVDAATLFPGVWRRWIFKHEIVEACTAIKGQALLHLLASGAEKVIYLDPDIAVFHDLSGVANTLDASSLVLTPHQVDPNLTEREVGDNELSSMKTGVYNLGFLAVRNDAVGRQIAKWWTSRLFHACYDDVANGIFTDQKYFDLIPGLFSGVHVERDPGYNVASWNLSRRDIEILGSGDIRVNGALLRFYHFTKINSDGDSMTERYADGRLAVFEIWHWYKRSLKQLTLDGVPPRYWRYHCFDDGAPIAKAARMMYRLRPALGDAFPDPFASGPGSYQDWFAANGKDWHAPIPEAAVIVGARRPAAQAASGSVAAVVHAYYPELFVEIRDLLTAYVGPLKLFVTTTADALANVRSALVGFSHPVEIVLCENRGRDVLPFLATLPRIVEEGHKFVLKLHTKKSAHRIDGKQWRRELLISLADPSELAWSVERLRLRPDVGIVAPVDHVLSMSAYWGSNEAAVRRLVHRMRANDVVLDPDVFVAGTMFIARVEALAAIASIGLSTREFEVESGQTDGTLAHAVERALSYSAALAGLKVAGKPALAAFTRDDFVFAESAAYRYAPRSDVAEPHRAQPKQTLAPATG